VTERWAAAQDYERSFWKGLAERIASGAAEQLTWYRRNADAYRSQIFPLIKWPGAEIRQVLEIGSGPIGIATFFGVGQCTAIDPLHDFYGADAGLAKLRNPDVRYLTGSGESLPFPDGGVDIVIIENVLDHTKDPDRVLAEIRRVLRPHGILFFKVNVRTVFGTSVHRLLSTLRIDRGHPHSNSANSIHRLIASHGFQFRTETVDRFMPAWLADLKSDRLKDKFKGILGVSEFWYSAICERPPS
jgi:ubiquinone/menaquinone biosynthesis C-methylase UbiE